MAKKSFNSGINNCKCSKCGKYNKYCEYNKYSKCCDCSQFYKCSNKTVIRGKYLCDNINEVDLKMCTSHKTIVTGKVTTKHGKPLNGAGVVILRIDKCVIPYDEIYMGVTFTQPDGTYAFSLDISYEYEYKITIYSPLIKQ